MPPRPRKKPYAFLPPLPRQARGGTVPRIQDLVRDAIVRLALPPGTFIDKAALCRRLGVSRFPVSEALGRLAAEGLVEVLPQRGTRVTRIDIVDCRQAMFIRRALEVEAVRALASQADAALLAELDRVLAGQRSAMESRDRGRFHDLDLALHELLLDALGFERVRSAVEAARASLDRMRLLLCTPERQTATFAEHQAIVAALRRHAPEAAAAAMAAHLDAVMAELEAVAAAQPDAFTGPAEGTVAA
ncbi:MAG: GntR family transcriptional regulator [Xanthobacteraceae bacterium]|nr:GntR family transcriptional regulator [Xanthobacteraceae bacterium]PWB60645.1 MAG: GntR family transcriptional regulator [Bradyrhizobiaceae bacterium]